MQILQWLFKVAHEEQARKTSPSPSSTNKKTVVTDQEAESNDQVKRRGSDSFKILLSRNNARTHFYSTLNLKRLGRSFQKRQHWIHTMKVKKEDSGAHVGNKVIPVCDKTDEQCGSLEKKEKVKGDKSKAISRMKELLKWAAAAKSSEKGGQYIRRKVLYFRNRGVIKAVEHDDQLSSDSPKISFKWDVGSCSTSSPAYSSMSLASSSRDVRIWTKLSSNSTADHNIAASDEETKRTMLESQDKDEFISRTGNWITTDTE
ncbi:hypothetical protein HHK36_022394 [Tetracentron sinense]|uniref:Uncharacterized protein n=1 Tax=Tetracentron sinense TaxID=13715 RepID=A0A834YMX6_TETSI|nr:hypothetical protein HHK36_022394 [Tetracentron sinense]